jgi:ribosomal protein S27E
MSDMKVCPECGNNDLTIDQANKNLLCYDCQRKHARTLKERLDINSDREEFR